LLPFVTQVVCRCCMGTQHHGERGPTGNNVPGRTSSATMAGTASDGSGRYAEPKQQDPMAGTDNADKFRRDGWNRRRRISRPLPGHRHKPCVESGMSRADPGTGLVSRHNKRGICRPRVRRLGLRDARCISWCHDRRVELHERNGWTHVPWFPDLHGRICIRRTNDHRSGNVPYRSHSRGLTGIHDAMELHCRERLTDLKSRGVTDDLSRRPGCEPHPGRWLVTPDPGTQPLITDPCGLRPW